MKVVEYQNIRITLNTKKINQQSTTGPGPGPYMDHEQASNWTIAHVNKELAKSFGNVGGNLGYSDFGLMLGFNLQERNFLGTGNSVGIAINKSIYQEVYNLSFYDPYYTIDGASRGYSLYYRKTDYGEFNIANYTSDSQGLGIQFGLSLIHI